MIDNFHVDMNEYLPLRDVVFQTLRNAILKGELQPGERLMEIQLAQRLGVSRTPVREAIRKLELEGLAIMIPRRGAIVADITIQDLKDVLELRAALEELAVQKACMSITEEQIQALDKAEKEFRDSLSGNDLVHCVEADMAFHEVIYEAAGNKRLQQMLLNLREQMYRYRLEYMKDRSMHLLLAEEHETVCRAIKNKDREKAGNAMRVHIDNQRDSILRSLMAGQEKR